jgi:hypothetical protein
VLGFAGPVVTTLVALDPGFVIALIEVSAALDGADELVTGAALA